MNECLWAVTLLLNAVISLRLLLFQAQPGQQRRLAVGGLAWGLIVFNSGHGVYVFCGWIQAHPGHTAAFALLAALLLRWRGNVARLLD